MYGRSAAGHRSTVATHQPAATTRANPAATSWRTRRQNPVGAATRYASASAGTTISACPILVRNANPMSTPASSNHRVEAASIARTVAYPAATTSSTSSASGLLNRNISTATGVSAMAAPASSPALGPLTLRTAA